MVQLAENVGLSAQSLSNVERGRQSLSEASLQRIAEFLRFPVGFFAAGDVEELQEVQLSFRARSKTSNRAKNAVKSSATIAVELREWIDQRFVTPTSNIPSIDFNMTPELAAEHVRARWGLSSAQVVPNTIHLLEANGVAVFSLPPEYSDVDAYSFWWRHTPFVMLSTTKTAERSRFDAIHELGHLVMHQNAEYGLDWRTAEKEANQFASAFLMPRAGVPMYISKPVTTDRIIRGKKRWRIAAMALAYRLQELGFLTEWSYRQIVIELGRLGYRTGEPDGVAHESSQLLGKVLSALREDKLPLKSIASDLNVEPDELRHITFGLVIRSVDSGSPAGQSSAPGSGRPLRLVE